MSSSSTSRGTWGQPVSRSKSRRAVPTTTAEAVAAAAAATPPAFSTSTTTKAVPAAATAAASHQPQPIQRFSQYGARFKSKPKAGSGVAAPARSPAGLSSRGFFSLGGGGGGSTGARGGGGGGGGSRRSKDATTTTINGNGREAGGEGRHRGHRERERERGRGREREREREGEREQEREREREPAKPKPPPPPRVQPRPPPLVGPAALAATINSTLTVTTGRAAGETISTSESSNTNGSGSGSAFAVGNGGGGGGGGDSGAEAATSPAYSETWEWAAPETPPASMPNLHQSSGSEDPSGSEDDEGFGLGGYRMDADYEKFVLQRRTTSASALKFRSAMASAPGGGSLGVTGSSPSSISSSFSSSSSSSRPSGKGAEGLRGPASAAAAAPPPPPSPLPQNQLLPPRVPRSMSVGGESGSALVQPSTAPPPLPARKPVGGGVDAPTAAPARSSPRRRPVSLKVARAKAAGTAVAAGEGGSGSGSAGGKEEEELRPYFRDPRLETTLGLIRSGQAFCQERHIVVDFVRRAKPAGSGKAEVQPTDDLLRHALLLTNAALYLLEVEMLPLPLPASLSPAQAPHHRPPSNAEPWDEAAGSTGTGLTPTGAAVATAAAAASGSGSGSSSSSRLPHPKGGGAGPGAGPGATGVIEKAKVKSIKLMDRLMPSELAGVSLPFREATLRNGDVVAKRGCGIVLHTKVDGRRGNLWLKCRSNQDRGALVDALVPWFETNSPGGRRELDVQQVPEGPLAIRLARFNASGAGDVTLRKDTDCVIS
eukprot:g6720.t1